MNKLKWASKLNACSSLTYINVLRRSFHNLVVDGNETSGLLRSIKHKKMKLITLKEPLVTLLQQNLEVQNGEGAKDYEKSSIIAYIF